MAGASAIAILAVSFAGVANAEVDPEVAARLQTIEARLAEQEKRLAENERLISEQRIALQGLQQAKDILLGELDEVRAGQTEAPANTNSQFQVAQQSGDRPLPTGPVGEAPPAPEIQEQDVAALPERAGVLTPRGRFVVDPSIEYVRSSANRLVFRGIEIVPGINFGLIEANEADRDTIAHNLGVRYGVTNRLELEMRGGWVWREDLITTVQQRDNTLTRVRRLNGEGWGDLELGARYQLNSGSGGLPIFVANGRLKAPTGEGPFDLRYNEAGVAQELATGSGFWGAEAGVTMLYPTDPGVIFGGLTYVYNRAEDVNKIIGGARVGEVDPGDAIGMNMGYGMSLNPRFSISFGYSHSYIFPTVTHIGPIVPQDGEPSGIDARSNEIHVGSMLMGWSFRLTPRITLSNNFEFGVTKDAPDMRWVLRIPYRF
ncbi:transporter [Phenylobacterium sp.]|uniref:transporter n=1 Tax=Phenylobacterium sp. TaxID=1871053 RepID=UPI002E336956|nr:transporter [Phenylobacterium sp.]HEX2559480.1 transporter [Phenylobacterium sp.]